jgi:hypothetical protein
MLVLEMWERLKERSLENDSVTCLGHQMGVGMVRSKVTD